MVGQTHPRRQRGHDGGNGPPFGETRLRLGQERFERAGLALGQGRPRVERERALVDAEELEEGVDQRL